MKTKASRKYITVDTIRKANLVLMERAGRPKTVVWDDAIRDSLPSKEKITNAGRNALIRSLEKTPS